MRKRLFFLLTFLTHITLFATHQRAGEISYTHVSGLTYEFKLVTYTYTPSPADRPEIEIFWGDGSSTIVTRSSKVNLPNDISINTYVQQHTFPAAGNYSITMEDPNRNAGIVNIPNSVNTPFFLETTLLINPFIGANSSPQLLNLPIDNGCIGQIYYHNPGAYDADGDSLSYKLVDCRGYAGDPVPGYALPPAQNGITIDATSGDLVWDFPPMQGEYNIAILIEEWRNGVLIGKMVRDMQITIVACNNRPPTIRTTDDTCVLAGTVLTFPIVANDLNSTQVTLSATGAPFQVTPPTALFPNHSGTPPISANFVWNTTCDHVKKTPYQLSIKAADNGPQVNLVAFKTVYITIVAPAPELLTATAVGNAVHLSWQPDACANAVGYRIYRRNGSYNFEPDHCETGLPSYTGYQLIGTTSAHLDTTFVDDGVNVPLYHGNEYCYRVVAFFADGAESYASEEVCLHLQNDAPLITHADVTATDITNGEIVVRWLPPTELDRDAFTDFQYRIFQKSATETEWTQQTILNSLEDSIFIANSLNTSTLAYFFKVELWGRAAGEWQFIETSDPASSVFLTIEVLDRALALSWEEVVPWTNEKYVIYRLNPLTNQFDSIYVTENQHFTDEHLENSKSYCYFVRACGVYFVPDTIAPLRNRSQKVCAIPADIVPPEIPHFSATTDCETVELQWSFSSDSAFKDVLLYNIYYKPNLHSPFTKIDSFQNNGDDCYTMECSYIIDNLPFITGCFAISAVDTAQNYSALSDSVCFDVDECMPYELPNVFTPDGDGVNDLFQPFPYKNVESVHFSVYDRWGRMVFKTTDPDLNWDGHDSFSKQRCTDGVYYYVCDVFLYTLSGIVKTTLHGSITIITKS